MNRNRRPGHWLAAVLGTCVLGLAVAHAQTASPDAQPPLELQFDRGLSELSQERLADGSAAARPQPAVEPPLQTPQATRPFSTLPALLLGGVLLALAAFAAGVFSARRRPLIERDQSGPVQPWADTGALEQEVGTLREQLAEQQLLNESLQSDRDAREEDLAVLRRQRDEAAGASQMLRMRGADGELDQAHETIDELRAELERLRGAESDLDRDPHSFAGGDDIDALRAELEARDMHVHELEEIMSAVRVERDTFEQSVAGRDAQIQALEQTLDHRDEELALLKTEIGNAHQQSGDSAALSDELEAARAELGDMSRQIETLQDQLNERHEAEDRTEELERRNKQLENDLGERRDELIQLAEQNDGLKARQRDLEFALKRDEDLTTRLELGSLQAGETGAATLDSAGQRVAQLEQQLHEAQQQIAQLAGESDNGNLQRQNVKLSAMVVQRDNMVAELEARVAQLEGDAGHSTDGTATDGTPMVSSPEDALPPDWTSTVSSLENELRRKMTVIDNQADHLRSGEHRVGELQAQIASLSEQLDDSRNANESLKALLTGAQAQAKALQDELVAAKLPGAQKPLAGYPHGEAVAADADVETLRRTVSSRQDLVSSLQSILDEEHSALAQARKQASGREDLLVSLENEIASNRITIAALQNRVSNAREHGGAPPSSETQRLERELQRGVRMIEKLRTDLHLWRRRVRPLHEAVVARDNRIRNLDGQVRAIRAAGLGEFVPAPRAAADPAELAVTEREQLEKEQYFQLIAELHEDIERLENELAETGLELSRVHAADETQVQEIENLEAARAAQALRMDELHHELMTLGVDPEVPAPGGDNVVELQAHRPNA